MKYLPANSSFTDIGSGLSRSKILYSILRDDLKTFAIEINQHNFSLAKKSLLKNNLPTNGLLNENLLEIPLPETDFYFIYLETGAVLAKAMEEIRKISLTRKITIIAIESHGDLIKTITNSCPWLQKNNIELNTSIPRHDQTIYFFESKKKYDHQINDNVFKSALNTLVKNKILSWDNIPKTHQYYFLTKLSFSKDFEVIIRDSDISSDEFYEWMGSTFNLKSYPEENTIELSYPSRTISMEDIQGIVIPEDFWWKYRFMRFDNDDYTIHGKIRKLIIKPKLMVELSITGKRLLYKMERGFTRIMKKRKVLKKKFEKEKKINVEHAVHGPHDFIIVLDHLKPDFNIGKIFRTAEAFGTKEVHIIGTDFFDILTAKGGFKRVKAYFYNSFEESYNRLIEMGYTPLCLDSRSDEFLHEIKLPQKTAFILGHEEFGPQFNIDDFEHVKSIKIKQFGVTESLNVAIAASIAGYEYVRQNIV